MYKVEIRRAGYGTLEFEDYESALAFYSGNIMSLRRMGDETTDVIFYKMQLGIWIQITHRLDQATR